MGSDLWKKALLTCLLLFLPVPAAAKTSSGHPDQSVLQAVPDALNPQLTNILEERNITLYYNGSGDVPEDGETSPRPDPISPLRDTSAIEDAIVAELIAVLEGSVLDECANASQL